MTNRDSSAEPPPRREVIREIAVFQGKLWVEGFKDVVLIPLSLAAALIDLLFRRPKGRGAFYAVMRLGDRFERWVNLYAPLDDGPDPAVDPSSRPGPPLEAEEGGDADDEPSAPRP